MPASRFSLFLPARLSAMIRTKASADSDSSIKLISFLSLSNVQENFLNHSSMIIRNLDTIRLFAEIS